MLRWIFLANIHCCIFAIHYSQAFIFSFMLREEHPSEWIEAVTKNLVDDFCTPHATSWHSLLHAVFIHPLRCGVFVFLVPLEWNVTAAVRRLITIHKHKHGGRTKTGKWSGWEEKIAQITLKNSKKYWSHWSSIVYALWCKVDRTNTDFQSKKKQPWDTIITKVWFDELSCLCHAQICDRKHSLLCIHKI